LSHAEALLAQEAHSMDELRLVAIGRTEEGRYTFVVFTPRPHHRGLRLRPLSARYMHQREVKKYEQEIARAQKR
jgi:uncharacterized protein